MSKGKPIRFEWTRFWIPRGGRFVLDDAAFLSDPDADYAAFYPTDAVKFSTMQEKPVLVLLGEPGIGKSDALAQERKRIENQGATSRTRTLHLNLGSYNSDSLLVHDLFESEQFSEQSADGSELQIFLDSLDECRLIIPNVANLLKERFKAVAKAKIKIRIACRGAIWPSGLEQAFEDIWGKDAVGIYTLAPLRRSDVVLACRNLEINSDAFLSDVIKKNAQAFASRPVSLRFLLGIYQRHGELPESRVELYRQGCRFLCEESSLARRDAGFAGEYSSDDRVKMAGKVAALSLLSNRPSVWLGLGSEAPENALSKELLESASDSKDERQASPDKFLQETLDTSLFSPSGTSQIEWSHRTYAEFLAAEHLHARGTSVEHLVRLLTHPYDLEEKFPPQLREVVAWLAAMDPQFFRRVISVEPDVLLGSDVSTAPGSDLAKLTEQLLNLYESERLFDFGYGLAERFSVLNHPQLALQVAPYISNSQKGIVVRRVAIAIAQSCKLKELVPSLIEVATGTNENIHIRVRAAHAVAQLGTIEDKRRLHALVNLLEDEDPDDELKGAALAALWPNSIAANELFEVLKPARNRNLFGAYAGFIYRSLVPGLAAKDLPFALRWIQNMPHTSQIAYSLQGVIDQILERALENVDGAEVRKELAETAWTLTCRHDRVFNSQGKAHKKTETVEHQEGRRLLLLAMVDSSNTKERSPSLLAIAGDSLVRQEDVPWLLERCRSADYAASHAKIVSLISALTHYGSPYVSEILDAAALDPVLKEGFRWLTKEWCFDDPDIEKIRTTHREMVERREKRSQLLEPSPQERIEFQLSRSEGGDWRAWQRLISEMTLEPISRVYDFVSRDVDTLPGWTQAAAHTRNRIIDSAKVYVRNAEPDLGNVLETNTWNQSQIAGWPALDLLTRADRAFLVGLDGEAWRKWIPLIVGFDPGKEDRRSMDDVFRLAYAAAPIAMINAIRKKSLYELSSEHTHFTLDRAIECIWDTAIEHMYLDVLRSEDLRPNAARNLLHSLLKHNSTRAAEFAVDFVRDADLTEALERARALGIAEALVTEKSSIGWPIAWPRVQENLVFGRELMLALSAPLFHDNVLLPVEEDLLAEIYKWLEREFPAASDPEHDGAYSVTARDRVGQLRDSIIATLKVRGTVTACRAIEKILQAFPDKTWLKWSLEEARRVTRSSTWIPPQPAELLALMEDANARIVRSGEELVEAILASLERLQSNLRGVTPLAFQLWDESPSQPKTEARISDTVKSHLATDLGISGSIVNREVEIRNLNRSGVGERTDILVQATLPGSMRSTDVISVVIEAKGCWNQDLHTAMESQLKHDYLRPDMYSFGVYLVAWFICDRWNKADYRKAVAEKNADGLDCGEIKSLFTKQAQTLSNAHAQLSSFILDATY